MNIHATHQQLNRYLTFTLNKRFDLAQLQAELGSDPDANTSDQFAANTLLETGRAYSDAPASPSGLGSSGGGSVVVGGVVGGDGGERVFSQSSTPVSSTRFGLPGMPNMVRSASHDPAGAGAADEATSPSMSRIYTPSASALGSVSVSTSTSSSVLGSAPPSANYTGQNSEEAHQALALAQQGAVSPITPNLAHSTSTSSDASDSTSATTYSHTTSTATHSRDSSSGLGTASTYLARKAARMQHYATLPAQYTGDDLGDVDEDDDEEFEPEFHSSEEEHEAPK
jgi:hypothetical protein